MNTKQIMDRLHLAAWYTGDAASQTGRYSLSAFQSVVGRWRWALSPESGIMVHLDDKDRGLHPWGAKWRWTDDGRVCPHCKSLNPIDWLDVASAHVRWAPRAAWEETQRLIDSGDLDDNMVNRYRAGSIPPGSARFVFFPGSASLAGRDQLVIETPFAFYTLAAVHLAELLDDDFEEFQVWFSENMPEISIHRMDSSVCVHFDPSASPEHTASGSCNHPSHEE
jgi:hypothetical protein